MSTFGQWNTEFDDFLRGVAGAFLFGVPLLYTMEVWRNGAITTPPHMLIALGATYTALVVLDRAVGFRNQKAPTWMRSLTDSAEALAIGLLMAAIGLLLVRRITSDMALDIILGHITMESVPFGIGVGIAGQLLRQGDNQDEESEQTDQQEADTASKDTSWRGTLIDGGSTLLGATVIALSIAPTDEVPTIAAAMSPVWLLGLVAVSLLLSYVIVFEADFISQDARRDQQGVLQSPLGETIFSYLLSVGAAILLLWFFEVVDLNDPWSTWLNYGIVLGLPATLGGAAGRLAI